MNRARSFALKRIYGYLRYEKPILKVNMYLDPELILKSYLDSKSIPHALLFIGQNEDQMVQSAKCFAKEALFQQDFKESHALKIDHLNHPDFHIMKPESLTGYYTIEQIKNLSKQSYLFPNESQKQFFILKNAERMADASANAFLKTLEEPTEQSIFILIVQNIDLMLPTILSRTQKVSFHTENELLEKPYQIELDNLLKEGGAFSYNDLFKACEKIQAEFDQCIAKSKKNNDESFFADKEASLLLIEVEKWYQKKMLNSSGLQVPKNVFEKKLSQAMIALERSTKLSICLEFLLLNFVS